jgi:hypothetical protein
MKFNAQSSGRGKKDKTVTQILKIHDTKILRKLAVQYNMYCVYRTILVPVGL